MLTNVKVRAAKTRENRYRLHDADGLSSEVRPNSSKLMEACATQRTSILVIECPHRFRNRQRQAFVIVGKINIDINVLLTRNGF